MRTNIEIDDELMRQALIASGASTKRDAVERGLKLLVQMETQHEIMKFRGKLQWYGDLDAMRTD